MTLRLRPYEQRDEAAAVAAHQAMLADDFTFLLDWHAELTWGDFLSLVEQQRRGENLQEGRVRAAQLVAEVDGELVGRASIRFELNEFLFEHGGHVGYGVIPSRRRRGYATNILREALTIIHAEGVTHVLMTCADDNVGSYRVIEHCGGVLETIVPAPDAGPGLRRYWID